MKKMSITINKNKLNICVILYCLSLVSCESISKGNQNIIIEYKKITNGNILPIGMKKNEKKEGLWLTYDDKGTLLNEVCFIDGKGNGPFRSYYDWNGQLLSKGTLLNDFEHGYFEQYNSNGTLYRKGTMNNGICEGVWELYTSDGVLNKKVEYKAGEIIKVFFDNKLEIPPPPMKKDH